MGRTARAAVRSLVESAGDEDENVRSAALLALSSIGIESKRLLPLLVEAFDSDSSSLRGAAVSATLKLGSDARKARAVRDR